MLHKVVIEIDTDARSLMHVTDSYLSTAWRVAQANPVPHGDRDAGMLAKAVGDEIVRRWLAAVPADQFVHQEADHYIKVIANRTHSGSAA